jgi:hypothetical protein
MQLQSGHMLAQVSIQVLPGGLVTTLSVVALV